MEFKKISDVSSLRNENVKNNEDENLIYLTTADFISEKQGIKEDLRDSINRSGKKFYKNDILISNIRPYFKKIWHANRDGITSNDVLIIKNDNNIENKYLYYVLSQDEFFEYATKTSKGTKMPRGDKKAIRKFEFYMPTRKEQIRAIRLLEQMEKKIEINNKIIQNLEDQAQALFKYYFVDFGPFKDGYFVDSELGKIPKGWEVVELSDISTRKNGFTYKSKDLDEDSNINMLTIKNFNRHGGMPNEAEKPIQYRERMKEHHFLKNNDLLVACTDLTQAADIIGRVILYRKNHSFDKEIFSMDLVKLILNNKEDIYYLYSYLKSSLFKDFASGISTGTTVLHLPKKSIDSFKIVYPSKDVVSNFSKIIKRLIDLQYNLKDENQKLAQVRDSILPRLMNGEIDLSNIELKED